MFEVIVAEDVLTAQPDASIELPGVISRWFGGVLFLVSPHPRGSREDLPGLAASAEAAALRFWNVTTLGVELPGTWASHDPCPNYVEASRVADDSVVVGASDDNGIDPPQAATMLQILLGELHSRRVSARVSCPPADLDVRGLPAWSPTIEENSGCVGEKTREMAPEVWFVDRRVHTVTTTGVPYTDVDWLHP